MSEKNILKKDSMGRELSVLTPTEISRKYASGHMACTREINRLIRHRCKMQRIICNQIDAPEPTL